LLLAHLRAAKGNQSLNADGNDWCAADYDFTGAGGIPDLAGPHDEANANLIAAFAKAPANTPRGRAYQALNTLANVARRVHERYELLTTIRATGNRVDRN